MDGSGSDSVSGSVEGFRLQPRLRVRPRAKCYRRIQLVLTLRLRLRLRFRPRILVDRNVFCEKFCLTGNACESSPHLPFWRPLKTVKNTNNLFYRFDKHLVNVFCSIIHWKRYQFAEAFASFAHCISIVGIRRTSEALSAWHLQ